MNNLGEKLRIRYLQRMSPIAFEGNFPEQRVENARELLSNPLLEGVVLSGGTACRELEITRGAEGWKRTDEKRKEVVKMLAEADSNYLENDWDANYPVVVLSQADFERLISEAELNIPENGILLLAGIGIACQKGDREGLDKGDQRWIVDQIMKGWTETDTNYNHAVVKEPSQYRDCPYILVGENARDIVKPDSPTDKSRFACIVELFVTGVPVTYEEIVEEGADIVYKRLAEIRGPLYRVDKQLNGMPAIYPLEEAEQRMRLPEKDDLTEMEVLQGIEAIVRGMDSRVYKGEEIEEVGTEVQTFLRRVGTGREGSFLQSRDEGIQEKTRGVWRRMMKQMLTRPEMVGYYKKIGAWDILVGEMPEDDLANLPPQMAEMYRKEIVLLKGQGIL